jgi:hypothetical protein
MFSHNTAMNKAMLCTPFYAMFGYDSRTHLWPNKDMFPEDREVEDERADPMLTLHHAREVVHSMVHTNNQHYQEQYTNQANQDRLNPRPAY